MRILVLGANGFAGTALCAALAKRGHNVITADRDNAEISFELANKESGAEAIKKSSPDTIILLSGASSVGESWKTPSDTFLLNTSGSLNVFESHLKYAPDARFIFAGSAEEYGRACCKNEPFRECDICTPSNPYALSKYSSAQTMHMLSRRNGTQFAHLRLANHFGPRQRKGFVVADFASQIAEKKRLNDNSDIKVGNLEVFRDFLYIDDVVDAYIRIAEADTLKHDTYNIGTGTPVCVEKILAELLNISQINSKVSVVAEKVRKVDIPILSVDSSLIREELGWKPFTDLKTALEKTLQYWS